MGELVDATALGVIPGVHPLPNPQRPYCSLGCKHYAPIQTIEQGEQLIQEIFQRMPLCWHAVDSINRIYQQVVHIEQGIHVEAGTNSVNILQLILGKVVGIAREALLRKRMCRSWNRTSHHVISYHILQKFLASELRVENLNRPLSLLMSEEDLRHAIAAKIPCCGSVEQFEQDLNDLLGEKWDDVIELRVEEKEQIAAPEQEGLAKILDIADCKHELSILRQQGLHYPEYYDELVERGFTNLYRYLNEMRTLDSHESKKAKILTMSFVQVFQVMHETYEALMQSVEQSIGPNPAEVIFLVGDTGVGKTTAFCAITGKTLKLRKDDLYDLVDESDNMIGHGGSSCTFLPSVHLTDGKAIVDFPGLRDTNGWPISLMIELVLLILANKYPSKILVLESITNDSGRYQGVAELATRLERIFGTTEKFIFGITKYSQDKDFEKKQGKRREREKSYSMYRELINEVEESIQELQEKISKIEKKIQKVQEESSSSTEDIQKQTNTLKLQLQDTQEKLGKKKASLEEYVKQLGLLSGESQEEFECQERIDEKEAELHKAIGINRDNQLIRFSNLESQETIEAIRTQLLQCQIPNHPSAPMLRLDPSIKQSIMDHFQQQFVPSLEFENRRFKNINTFGASVLNIGLTATVSSPVVWRVLNLPGMDPTLADQFDKGLLDVCITGFMKMIFSDPAVNYIHQLVVNLREQNAIMVEPTTKQLMDKWQTLETYIITLLGLSHEVNTDEANRQWQMLKERYTIKHAEQIHLPAFLRMFLPARICLWLENKINNLVEIQSWEQNLQANKRTMTDIEHNLVGLQLLKSFLVKKDEIHQIVKSASLSFGGAVEFFKSIEKVIEQVRQISGVDDWDKRIPFLTSAFINSSLHHSLNSQNSFVFASKLLRAFLEFESGKEDDMITLKKSDSESVLKIHHISDRSSSALEKQIFDTWKISSDSLTPLMSLQLIHCVMKSGVHMKLLSYAEERRAHKIIRMRIIPDPSDEFL